MSLRTSKPCVGREEQSLRILEQFPVSGSRTRVIPSRLRTLLGQWRSATARSALALGLTLASANYAEAQLTVNWNNTASLWQQGFGWSSGNVPGADEIAAFPNDVIDAMLWDEETANRQVFQLRALAGDHSIFNEGPTQHSLTINSNAAKALEVSGPSTRFRMGGLQFIIPNGGGAVEGGAQLDLIGDLPAGAQVSMAGGFRVDGALNVNVGSVLESADGTIGSAVGTTGTATVSGFGSSWLTGLMVVGNAGTGTLNVQAGGSVNTSEVLIGETTLGGNGTVNLAGVGSKWTNSGILRLGSSAIGTLNIRESAEFVNVGRASIGVGNGPFPGFQGLGAVTVTGAGSKWTNQGQVIVGEIGPGSLRIEAGGEVTSAAAVLGFDSADIGLPPRGDGTVTVTGTGSKWTNSTELTVGNFGLGTLNIEAGGLVTNATGRVGQSEGGAGIVTVTGAGSTWKNTGLLTVGIKGTGTLNIQAGGTVENSNALIGTLTGGNGAVNVSGAGSKWKSSGDLTVGLNASGSLKVEAEGDVINNFAILGRLAGSVGTATVTGSGSKWTTQGDLEVGRDGVGTINVDNEGVVTVSGNTTINAASRVNLNGGKFDFGTMDQFNFPRVIANSGILSGTLNVSGSQAANSLAALNNAGVDSSGVNLVNAGTLSGPGSLGSFLTNQANSEVELLTGERLRFRSTRGSQNFGEINNLGGRIDFQGAVTNEVGGFIAGRGAFAAQGGWNNLGVMAFSGGFADVLGDVTNGPAGKIVIAGGSTTTFFDDVLMAAGNLNVDVSQNSDVVFFGSYNGGSSGPGTVHALGDLRPGNSPAAVRFGGDLKLGATTVTQVELGGLTTGTFDQLLVAGNLFLDGQLNVQLIDGFTLSPNQTFDVGLVGGALQGQFSNLSDGARVGTFGGIDLFIDYRSIGTNQQGFSLVTAVPEPSSALLVGLGIALLGLRTRRRDV